MSGDLTPAHDQAETRHYTMHYPAHPARVDDPHYRDFEAIHRAWKADPDKWRCAVGAARGDFTECDLEHTIHRRRDRGRVRE